ncbi:MAG: hypothetical protein K2F64_02930 [Muribaculaceae bacterium]|nr:hypothetical protein [Muribaculaceae bacterium]
MSDKFDHNDNTLKKSPFKVPEGYFNEVSARIVASLPEYPEAPVPVRNRSLWQRIAPYASLAAMFVGVWCMMKIFHSASSSTYSLDNPPEAVMIALNDPDTFDFYTENFLGEARSSSISDVDLESEVGEMYSDIDDMEQDLGISLKPEYDNIVIN